VLVEGADDRSHDRGEQKEDLMTERATGPLTVSEINPRYFSVPGEDRAVYLTGSHIWNNLHDGMGPGADCADEPEAFDYEGYLGLLQDRGHTFMRLWRWENFRSRAAGDNFHLCMRPQPWARTGPSEATDGKPRFDLERFDQSFFDRMRERVIAAGERGIYVGVMLFDGWALHLSPAPLHVEGHPFHEANNVNGIGIGPTLDYQVLPLDPRVQELQESYVRHVIDTVHDLPNVLWEVANESSGGGPADPAFAEMLGQPTDAEWGDSTEWQYWVIDVVRKHEADRGYERHPIGMTMQFPVREQTKVNDPLYAGEADWISPGYDDEVFAQGGHPMAPDAPDTRWLVDPPVADGRKVVVTDTDHYAQHADELWAWKSFLRGHHPILMDYGLISGVNPPDPTAGALMSFEAFEAARWAMGDTARFAERMDLLRMEPRTDVSSTGYALANAGTEYLVLEPTGGGTFTVRLEPGTYSVEWFAVEGRQSGAADRVSVDRPGDVELEPPPAIDGPAVVYLKAAR